MLLFGWWHNVLIMGQTAVDMEHIALSRGVAECADYSAQCVDGGAAATLRPPRPAPPCKVDYSHRCHKVLRDIKLSNTLLVIVEGQLPMLKLGDFSCSRDVLRDKGPLPQVGFTAKFLPNLLWDEWGRVCAPCGARGIIFRNSNPPAPPHIPLRPLPRFSLTAPRRLTVSSKLPPKWFRTSRGVCMTPRPLTSGLLTL